MSEIVHSEGVVVDADSAAHKARDILPGWRPGVSEERTDQVYLIASKDLSLVKIGFSISPKRRVNELRGDGWKGCRLIATRPASKNQELEWQMRFGKEWAGPQHDGGVEWFHNRNQLSALVDALRSGAHKSGVAA